MVSCIAVVRRVLCVGFPLVLLTVACGNSGAVAPSGQSGSGIQDDASLFRLITQTEPLTAYVPFPNAEEFTAGRLNGSEAHRPIVRTSLNARAMRHKLSGRLSPNKTWEGLVGGLVLGPLFGALLAAMWEFKVEAGSLLTWRHALQASFLVALVSPVGDLGISMFKRQAGVKDTGSIFMGHGGVLDRIDSWLVAGVVGYMYITFLGG